MVLLSFSIPDHIPKIKDGRKGQTTRTPRKLRSNGKPAYSIGEKVQLYYRSRMAPDCRNCLNTGQGMCPHITTGALPEPGECPVYRNFFGESEIIDIIHYHSGDYKERHHEIWMGHSLALSDDEDQQSWSIADGFSSFDEAHDYFYKSTGNLNWADQNLDVIVWSKDEIVKRWQQK